MTDTVTPLPQAWESFLRPYLDLEKFYNDLRNFIKDYDLIIPRREQIFNVFNYMTPADVRCVLYGEDPYPRLSSACGVAFWDREINSWHDKTNGNSLKNMLKALLVAEKLANYRTTIAECRTIAASNSLKSPSELFEHWLQQGVLLLNTALTFSDQQSKAAHFNFWQPFHKALIKALNGHSGPYYVLWGKKAQNWENEIIETVDDPSKIIKQGHPTFIHQFLKADQPDYSPFTQLSIQTGIKWV